MDEEKPIIIAGCGPGSPDYLIPEAKRAIEEAEVLVGSRRLLGLFPDHPAERVVAGTDVPQVLEEILIRRNRKVVVLVTGDPGLCSLANPVLRRFGHQACHVIPGVSSVQVAFARVGIDWLNARIIDAHGEDPGIELSSLAGEEKIAVLAGRTAALRWTSRLIRTLGKEFRIYLCEDLTLRGEKVREIKPEDLETVNASPRTVILLIRERQDK